MGKNAIAFSIKLKQALDETRDEMATVVQKIGIEALSRIVEKTPVKTGRARGNWSVSIGQPSSSTPIDTEDKTGSATIAKGTQEILTAYPDKGFPIISIYNSLPYILALEEGKGSFSGAKMVALTKAELEG